MERLPPPSALLRSLPTDHYGIVTPPHVHAVAETITATLADTAAGPRPHRAHESEPAQ